MILKKIGIVIALVILYLSPLSSLSIRVVTEKTFNVRHMMGQSIAFVSFLLVTMLWMKDFSASSFTFLKNYSIVSKFLITILLFYITSHTPDLPQP